MRLLLLFAPLLLSGCLVTQVMIDRVIDSDNDGHWEVGYHDGLDCDDEDPAVNPDQGERCLDSIDNDCDGLVDEDGVNDVAIFRDLDADGHGDPATQTTACYLTEGWSPEGDDCDDSQSDILPDAPEACNDLDDDCDGTVDEGAPGTTWYFDDDGDGWGDDARVLVQCQAPEGFLDRGGDCDDLQAAIHPGAEDAPYDAVDADCGGTSDFDQDGDGWLHPSSGSGVPDCDDLDATVYPGVVDPPYDGVDQDCDPAWEFDADHDGLDAVEAGGGDCDDTTALVRPGNAETWYDGVDQDCDAATEWDQDGDGLTVHGAPLGLADDCDDRSPAVLGPSVWYLDDDQDGWGLGTDAIASCAALAGRVTVVGDCDDTRGSVSPSDPEVCGGSDEDCDGSTDEDVGEIRYFDRDGDGHGDAATEALRCPPYGDWVVLSDDCDDLDPLRSPSELESCNAVDDDCDGVVDEDAGPLRYPDLDRDGYGDRLGVPVRACLPSDGLSLTFDDCDDGSSFVHPDRTDACDGVNADCDGFVDEDGWLLLAPDGDADGYGVEALAELMCPAPGWVLANEDDCDDDRSDISPRAIETCDGEDDDCVGGVDNGVAGPRWPDADGDGWGSGDRVWACNNDLSFADAPGDCDEASVAVSPGAAEVCNGVDDDCDLFVDEFFLVPSWPDVDGDTYGDDRVLSVEACPLTPGLAQRPGDCDDEDDAVSPDATEVCDGVDNNCRLGVDEALRVELWPDLDADGWGDRAAASQLLCPSTAGFADRGLDCDDVDRAISPSEAEVCDGVDNDCDDGVDEGLLIARWPDVDGDGWGDAAVASRDLCPSLAGYADRGGDCADRAPGRNPGVTERCDDVDNDCDGDVDEALRIQRWPDADGDTWGDRDVAPQLLCPAWAGFADRGADCADTDPGRSPSVSERCDQVDNDCDDVIDDGVQVGRYRDADGDTFGAGAPVLVCQGLPGYARTATDCDDADPSQHPGAVEVCNREDDNCDNTSDEGLRGTLWRDADGDGWGAGVSYADQCLGQAGTAAQAGDCDDALDWVNPGETEDCNGVDDDCDVAVDEGVTYGVWPDADRDTYGDASSPRTETCVAVAGMVTNRRDCDDRDVWVHPGVIEQCNGVDDDCDGTVDPGITTLMGFDFDQDGHGDPAATTQGCPGHVEWAAFSPVIDDCDDFSEVIFPGADEICDGIDNDCDPCTVVDPEVNGRSVCGGDRFVWGDHIYQTAPNQMTWTAARDWCSGLGYAMWRPDTTIVFIAEERALGAYGYLPAGTSWHTSVEGTCGGVAAGGPFYDDSFDGTCSPVSAARRAMWGPLAVDKVLVVNQTLAGGMWSGATFDGRAKSYSAGVVCELPGSSSLPEFVGGCGP